MFVVNTNPLVVSTLANKSLISSDLVCHCSTTVKKQAGNGCELCSVTVVVFFLLIAGRIIDAAHIRVVCWMIVGRFHVARIL